MSSAYITRMYSAHIHVYTLPHFFPSSLPPTYADTANTHVLCTYYTHIHAYILPPSLPSSHIYACTIHILYAYALVHPLPFLPYIREVHPIPHIREAQPTLMSRHHTYYVTSSYILCLIIIHALSHIYERHSLPLGGSSARVSLEA